MQKRSQQSLFTIDQRIVQSYSDKISVDKADVLQKSTRRQNSYKHVFIILARLANLPKSYIFCLR